MTPRYVLEQLNRYQKDTEWENEDQRRWQATGKGGSEWLLPHNQGHLIAIEATRNLVKSMGNRLDKDVVKKFAKAQIEKCQAWLKNADKSVKTEEDEDKVWNDEYFRTDGIDCGYRTILNIVRDELYFDKNPQMPEWTTDWVDRMEAKKGRKDADDLANE